MTFTNDGKKTELTDQGLVDKVLCEVDEKQRYHEHKQRLHSKVTTPAAKYQPSQNTESQPML